MDRSTRLITLLCVFACAMAAAVEVWPAARRVLTEDRNGDGAPDIWREYDTRGRLALVEVDSNFDGSPDIEEYYDRGVLVRRESDRNFNGRADLVEEFDAETHEQTRTIVDVDDDGTADLLVVFRDGRPVYSARANPLSGPDESHPVPAAVHGGRGRSLIRLVDPFEQDPAVRAIRIAANDEDCVGLSTSGGLPLPRVSAIARIPLSARLIAVDVLHRSAGIVPRRSPRAPPAI